jgi:putative FmdB family regulatory protein
MPLYEYVCHDCEETVTVLTRTYDAPGVPACPSCGGDNLRRVISRVAVAQAQRDRLQDMSWLDQNIKRRFERKLQGGSLLG